MLIERANTGNAWTSTSVAFAIGDGSENTRQINGLAAGTADTDAVNVAQLIALVTTPVSFYNGGKLENTYTQGSEVGTLQLDKLKFDFGDGLKVSIVEKSSGDKVMLVSLEKNSLKSDPDFKGDIGDSTIRISWSKRAKCNQC